MDIARWLKECRQAARRLAGSPAFSVTILLVFAVATGIAAAVSSLATATQRHAVPYRDPDRLVRLYEFNRAQEIDEMHVSLPTLRVWREESDLFETIGTAHVPLNLTLSTADGAARLVGGLVSPAMFRALGVQPVHGRPFTEEEGRLGAPVPAVILSHAVWTNRFGGDTALVGTTLTIDGMGWTVVGVLPPGIPLLPNVPEAIEAWLPLGQAPAVFGRDISQQHNFRAFHAIGRVRAGIADAVLADEVQRLGARIAERFPESSQGWEWGARPLREAVTLEFRDAVRALLLGSLLLLAVALTNVFGLFAQRARETATTAWVRITLGATPADLRRAAISEAMLLTVSGTAAGLGIAQAAIVSRDLWIPFPLPPHVPVMLDRGVAMLAVLLAVGVAWSVGALTSVWWRRHATRRSIGGGAPGRSMQSSRSGRLVLGVQVALGAVLTVIGVFTVQSLVNLLRADTGVNANQLLTARVDVPAELYPEEAVARTAEDIRRELETIPGVAGVALWSPHVPVQAVWHTAVRLLSRPDLQDITELPLVRIHAIGPGAATLLGLRFIEGRDFTTADRDSGRRVALVSETAAREWWGTTGAIGRRIRRWNHEEWSTVVGVVRDAPLAGREGDGSDFFRDVFLLHSQDPQRFLVFLIRGRERVHALEASVTQTIRATTPNLPTYAVRAMDDILRSQERVSRSTAVLGIAFAVTALVLMGVGLYGVLATEVTHKAFEISVRKALGATPTRIVAEVTAPIWLTLAVGVLAGLGLAWSVAPPLMAGVLFEVAPRNTLLFGVAGVILVVATAPAIFGPAARGAARSPALALRRGAG